MAIPSVYINLEDDVSKIVTRLKHQSAVQLVLVCPKRCFLFSDSINLKLLKKQTDMMGKEIFILTMDERGQLYATEAGFQLKFLPKAGGYSAFSDIKRQPKSLAVAEPQSQEEQEPEETKLKTTIASAVKDFSRAAKKVVPLVMPILKTEVKAPAEVLPPVLPEEKVAVTESFFPAEIEAEYTDKPKKSHNQKIIIGILAITLAVILLLVFVVLPKASVVVFPKTEALTRDMQITLNANVQDIDVGKLVLPALRVDDTLSVSDTFQSQGKNQIGNKASGTVKIYNFTKLPISLKAATTVLVVGDKTYNLVNDVSDLRPTTYINSRTKEIDQNSLGSSVEIIAAQGGDDYNLPAGTRLEISNQVFGSRPQLLYAKSDSEITGGTTRYLSVINQDDLTGAQQHLQDEAVQQENQKLQGSGEVLADGAYSVSVSQFATDNPVDTQTPTFHGKLQVQITGLAFKQADLDNLVQQRIIQALDTDKTLQPINVGQISYKAAGLDMANQVAVLNTHYEGQAVFNVDLSNIKPELVGKSQQDVNEILSSKAAIEKVEITLAPVWQKNFPLFASKISLTVAPASENNP